MWGVVVGALLVTAGVALVIHGSYSLDAQRERHEALLFSSVLSSFMSGDTLSSSSAASAVSATSTDDQAAAFLSSATFGYAMDAPVYTSFYLLNLTNAEDVLSGEAQPQLQQVGPITYEKKSRKINVQFEAKPFQLTSLSYGYVRYQVLSSYHFVPEHSNGTESDRIVTVNATYARRLQKLRNRGYSERLMLAEFAQQHVQEYTRHLRQEFLADTKLRAWSHFLPALIRHVQQEVLPAVVKRQQQRVDASSIPSNLVRMYAVARTEMIPRVLGDIYKDISDQFLPEIMQNNLDNALQQALPRVLENLYTRLQVESVPFFLQKQLASQQMRHVPRTLASLALKIDSIAFPYVLQEVYDRACLEAVPSILRAIKTEIVAQDIANNRVSADVAQRNVMENWRRQGATPTNFDSWIDDAPTGKARAGFELLPSSSSLQLSVEAATLILGSKTTNQTGFEMNPLSDPTRQVTQAVRELLWDRTKSASFLVSTHPSDTDLGFGIWVQGIQSSNFARIVDKIKQPALTEANSAAIAVWVESWVVSELNILNVYNWWRLSTCWLRKELSATTPSSTSSTGQSTCVEAYKEVESSSVVTSTDSQSPYFTFEKTYHVTDDKCVWDATTKTYTRTSSTYDIKAQVFSCDAISTSLTNDLDESTFGFELMPAATSASDRISLAAASTLWNPLNSFSFLHEGGYKQWFTLDSSDSVNLLQAINAEIAAGCLTLSGGGVCSGIFNETLAGVSCDVLSQSHFEDIQAWVRSQSSSEWIQDALLNQWRRGTAGELEIEPYRSGDQRGWELATGCSSQCTLTEDSGLVYQVPRSALSLWTPDHPATFLTSKGHSMWTALSNATRFADPIATKAAKGDIIAACKEAKWEDWMQHVFEWLEAWKSNGHLFRDVLGHWMHAQCPTTPHLVSVIQRQPDAITTTASYPPPEARYTVTLKKTITDLQRTASRSTEYFRADIVETSALVQPTKVVEVEETWITCEELAPTSFK
ncbi:hypothetical protein FI667_g8193, partial [Globisporangium splendens]